MLDELRAVADALPASVRAALADHWSSAALAEHASVASFSRFSLHLLAVGAPPELLHGAHQAALDEVRHANLCFSIASAFHGHDVGPGPLDLSGDVIGPTDLPSVVRAAVIEGCVGETIAALEARHAADMAEPDFIRSALVEIADDEQAHAQLAWQFVAWAARTGGADIVALIAETIRGVAEPELTPETALDLATAGFGRVSAGARARIQVEGLREVVRPTAAALLDGLR